MKRHGLLIGGLLLAGLAACSSSDEAGSDGGAPDESMQAMRINVDAEGGEGMDGAVLAFDEEEPAPEESLNGGSVSAAQIPDAKKADGKDKKPVKTWKRSRIVPNTSKLSVGDDADLPLEGMQASVRVDGFRARVLLDLYYRNDRDQQLEGTFKVRLPNEASPHFLAFGPTVLQAAKLEPEAFLGAQQIRAQGTEPDELLQARAESWTQVKVARIVPKEKAAHAYRQVVRRRVDPALMEWSGAGTFNARVFPLEPGKLHRISIGYDVDLLAVGEDFVYRLDLPSTPQCLVDVIYGGDPDCVRVLPKPEEVKTIAAEVVPNGEDSDPEIIEEGTHYRFENPERRVVFRFKGEASPSRASVLFGGDEATGPLLAASFVPELPAEEGNGGSPRAVFAVDTSLTSNPEAFNVYLQLLQAVLEENRETLREFAVLFFNVERFWWKQEFTANTPENTEELLAFAKELALEGATDLGAALGEAAAPNWFDEEAGSPRDLFLLSDGAATWGDADPFALSRRLGSSPLFAYRTGLPGASTRTLQHLARESGGAVFSVVGEAEVPKAATAHRARPWQIESVTVDRHVDVLLAGRPTAIYPGQRLQLAARSDPNAEPRAGTDPSMLPRLTLRLSRGSQALELQPELGISWDSELTARIYGQIATGQLEELSELTEDTATAYARQFRIAGKTCSLLMLESERDYEEFGIKPEEDALVVKTNLASEVVAKALADIGEALGDPKAGFLAFLKKLERMPGMEIEISLALRQALERLPSEAYAVDAPPLACTERTWKGIPGALTEQLASRELDYTAWNAEAKRRLEASPADALRALSTLVENRPGDTVMARDVGYMAMEWGLGAHAYHLFRRVAGQRPWEPLTYGAMADCLRQLGNADLAIAWYEVGLAGTWNERFGAFREIHGLSYLRFLRQIAAGEVQTQLPEFAAARLKTVEKEFDLGAADLVVMVGWNTDGTDVDLHVIEPSGEECYYSHPKTQSGGRLTRDVTTGYGPEMFVLKKAPEGAYRIRVKYFASDANRTKTRTKVFATIYEDWGKPTERVTSKTLTLATGKEMHDVLTVKRR